MKKIAIDVVVLLPEKVTEKVIELNREIVEGTSGGIILDREDFVPHISLCMGVVREEDLGEIEIILREILEKFEEFHLDVEGIESRTNPLGKTSYRLEIAENDDLHKLHEEIARQLKPFLQEKASEENFVLPLRFKELTIKWVEEYFETSAFEKFRTHVSLGFGKFDKELSPFSFSSSKLAVFQLGEYCTCRRKLLGLDTSC